MKRGKIKIEKTTLLVNTLLIFILGVAAMNLAVDTSGNNNNGIPHSLTYVPGPFGKNSLHFNATIKNWMETPHSATLNFGVDDWSINFWLKKVLNESTIGEVVLGKAGIAHYPAPPTYDADGYALHFRSNATLWLSKNFDKDPLMRVNLLEYPQTDLVDEAVERFPNINLLLDWSFDTAADTWATGKSVFDASGQLHFGYYQGGADRNLIGGNFSWCPNVLTLDGVDSYVSVNTSLNTADGANLTFAAWIKGTGPIYSAKGFYAYEDYFSQNGSWGVCTSHTDTTKDEWACAFPGGYDPAALNFVVVEVEQIGADYVKRIYANDVLVDDKTVANKTFAKWDAPFYLGKTYVEALYFTGQMDEVKIYDKILTAGEKTLLYTNNTSDWKGNVLCEPSEFKTGATYIGWYRAGFPNSYIGYATSADGVNWTDDPANPVSFAPTIADGATMFPVVVYEGGHYYMFVKSQTDGNVYLFDMDDPVAPAVLNGGLPVLEPSQAWEDGTIYNLSVAVVNGVWHMLYEAGSGGEDFNIGYTHSTLAALDWTANKSALNPMFPRSCPHLVSVPDRNALLVLMSEGYQYYNLATYYAYLSDNLDLPASWQHGLVLRTPDQTNLVNGKSAESDPTVIVGFSVAYPIMITYNHFQTTLREMYSDKTLNAFFDSIIVDKDEWHMLSVTNLAGVLKFYLDGVLRFTGTWNGNVTNPGNLTFGRVPYYAIVGCEDVGWLTGDLADIHIYNGTALTQANITDLYANTAIADTDLVLHYPLSTTLRKEFLQLIAELEKT
jgi:hypothetical protein